MLVAVKDEADVVPSCDVEQLARVVEGGHARIEATAAAQVVMQDQHPWARLRAGQQDLELGELLLADATAGAEALAGRTAVQPHDAERPDLLHVGKPVLRIEEVGEGLVEQLEVGDSLRSGRVPHVVVAGDQGDAGPADCAPKVIDERAGVSELVRRRDVGHVAGDGHVVDGARCEVMKQPLADGAGVAAHRQPELHQPPTVDDREGHPGGAESCQHHRQLRPVDLSDPAAGRVERVQDRIADPRLGQRGDDRGRERHGERALRERLEVGDLALRVLPGRERDVEV